MEKKCHRRIRGKSMLFLSARLLWSAYALSIHALPTILLRRLPYSNNIVLNIYKIDVKD